MSIFAKVDDYGFLITPYRVIKNGKVTEEIRWLRADEESNAHLAPADTLIDHGKLAEERVLVRYREIGRAHV